MMQTSFPTLWFGLIECSKNMTTEIVSVFITLSHFTMGRKSVTDLKTDIQIKMSTVGYSLPEKHKDRKNERATIISSTCQKELSLDTQTVLTRARCYLPEGCSSAVPDPRHAMFHSLKLHNNQEPGDGYVPATDLTEFLDEADISEGPLADPMHVENHVGDHMVRGPGDPGKHIDAVFIDPEKDSRRVVRLAEVLMKNLHDKPHK